MNARLLPIPLLLCCSPFLVGQTPPFVRQLHLEAIPHLDAAVTAAASGDVDGDGHIDLVFALPSELSVHPGDGRGRFEPGHTDQTGMVYARDLILADLDGDLDLDAVIGDFRGVAGAFLNDGQGSFSPAAFPFPQVTKVWDIVAADFNRDGAVDLIVTGDPSTAYLQNLGGGRGFVDATATHLPPRASLYRLITLDYDSDGDTDVLAYGSNVLRLLRNDGSGVLSDVSAGLPSGQFPGWATAADFDNDGRLDIAWGGSGLQDRLYLNSASGMFQAAPAGFLPANPPSRGETAQALDVDGDQDIDLVLPGTRLLLNDGGRRLLEAPEQPVSEAGVVGYLAVDVNRDGRDDLVAAAHSHEPQLLFGDSSGRLRNASLPECSKAPVAAVTQSLGDMDGDGLTDIVVGATQKILIYRQTSPGQFVRSSELLLANLNDQPRVATGDVDGDGDTDVLVGGYQAFSGMETAVFLNDGTGNLSHTNKRVFPGRISFTRTVALFDADGDGDLDAFRGEVALIGVSGSELWRNDGRGNFTLVPGAIPSATGSLSARPADIDGDGDQDLVIGEAGVSILWNDGAGSFSLGPQSGFASPCYHLDCGDIDQDGDLDILAGAGTVFFGGQAEDQILVNLGNGTFQTLGPNKFPSPRTGSFGAAFFDMDGDGSLDILTSESFRHGLYLNDGSGSFVDASAQEPSRPASSAGIQVADLDLDGDPDIVEVGAVVTVRSNLQRELHSRYLVGPGESLELEIWCRASSLPIRPAWLLIAPRALNRPIQVPGFGWLGVNPSASITVSLALQGIRDTVSLPVPNDPAFADATIHFQALILENTMPDDLRLTRRLAVRLR